jgi:hypothetical protein
MTRDEFFADPVGYWFSDECARIAPMWFAEVWRTDPVFREAVTHETKRYVLKVGALVEPGLLGMLAQALTRDEILDFAEDLRRHARGRVMEWGAEFEKAFAGLGLILSVPVTELKGVGECLQSAVSERDVDRVRFLVRCMRDAGLSPEQAAYKEIVSDLPLQQIAQMPWEEFDRLPVRWVPVVEYAEGQGLQEIAQIIRSGGRQEAARDAAPDRPRD